MTHKHVVPEMATAEKNRVRDASHIESSNLQPKTSNTERSRKSKGNTEEPQAHIPNSCRLRLLTLFSGAVACPYWPVITGGASCILDGRAHSPKLKGDIQDLGSYTDGFENPIPET